MNTAWNDLTELEQAAVIYSDMHKDAYGFRPRNGGVHAPTTLAEYDAAFASMQDTIRDDEAEDAKREAAALAKVEDELSALMTDHGLSRADALRWWMEAEGFEPADYGQGRAAYLQDAEHILWKRGVGYQDMRRIAAEYLPGQRV